MTKQSTMIHLEREQKAALQERARQRGSSMAAEVRAAVDQYLATGADDDLATLADLSKAAEQELERMSRRLDEVNASLDRAFDEMARLRRRKAA